MDNKKQSLPSSGILIILLIEAALFGAIVGAHFVARFS